MNGHKHLGQLTDIFLNFVYNNIAVKYYSLCFKNEKTEDVRDSQFWLHITVVLTPHSEMLIYLV